MSGKALTLRSAARKIDDVPSQPTGLCGFPRAKAHFDPKISKNKLRGTMQSTRSSKFKERSTSPDALVDVRKSMASRFQSTVVESTVVGRAGRKKPP